MNHRGGAEARRKRSFLRVSCASAVFYSLPLSPAHSPVPPCQSLVRNGEAGRPARLMRLGFASLCQPNRTCVGRRTEGGFGDDRIAVDRGAGGDELPVGRGNLKLAQRIAVAGGQAAVNMGELQTHFVAFDRHALVERTGIDDPYPAVFLGECPQGQSLAHVNLIGRMDVVDVTRPDR